MDPGWGCLAKKRIIAPEPCRYEPNKAGQVKIGPGTANGPTRRPE